MSWSTLAARFGSGSSRRSALLESIKAVAHELRKAGGRWLFVDGSFVTTKPVPRDWDGCIAEEGLDFALLDPLFRDVEKHRPEIQKKYRCDLFFANTIEGRTRRPFREFFQQTDWKPKGIIVLDLSTVP